MAIITNTIRWASNTEELKKNLLEGIGTLDAMKSSVDRTVASLSGTGLFGAANKVAAAITQMGGVTKLTAAEQERANAIIQKAIEKYEAMGIKAPQALRDIAAATKKTEESTVSLQTKLSSMQSVAQSVGIGLSAAVTAPLVGMGAASLKASMDFETAFAGVKKTVSGTPQELDKINVAFREMAKTTPVSAVGLALIGEQAGQLGVQKEKIIGFTKTIVDISVATNLTADEAGSAFARLANVMKMPQEQFSNLGSAVVALGNFGASTEQEMLNMGQRIAAAGATAGMSVAQVLGLANAMSSVGIEAESGGTAMSRVINKISMDVASGGGKLQTFARIAGESAQEFQKAWRDDAGAAFAKFMQGLANAREHGGDQLLSLMHELGFDANVRLVNAFMSAANAGDLVAKSMELGSKAFKENTELARASEERYKTTANQLKILWNNLTDVAMTIGDTLTPMVNDLVVALKPMVASVSEIAKGFKDLPEPLQLSALGVAAVAASLGPLLLVGSGVISLMLKWEALLVAFPAVGAAATATVEALTTGMLGMVATAAGVIGLVAAVGALSYALTRLADNASGGKLSGWIAGAADAKLKTEEAAAGADSMALAFQRTNIHAKDAADALRINTEWLKKHNAEMSVGTTAITAFYFEVDNAGSKTQTLADKVKALTEVQKADIISKRVEHESIKAIATETGIAADVISMFLAKQKDATKGTDDWAKALNEYNSVGASYRDTVEQMSGATVEGIRYDLARGQSQTVIARLYGVTAVQIKAIIELDKQEQKAQEPLLKAIQAITQARIDAASKSIQLSGLQQQEAIDLLGLGVAHATIATKIGATTTQVDVFAVALKKSDVAMKEFIADIGRLPARQTVPLSGGLAPDLSRQNSAQQIARQFDYTGEALARLSDGFVRLGQSSGGALGSILSEIGQMTAQLYSAHLAVQQIGKDGQELGGNFGQLSVLFNHQATSAQKMGAAVASAAAIAQGAHSVWAATESHASTAGNALGGAMAGAQAGAAFGPYGIAIGAAAGLIVGLIRGKPAWAKAATEVGRDFGVKISDGLAQAIAKDARELFHGDRFTAEVFNLSKILSDAGGLTDKNLAQMTGKLRDTFSLIQQGQLTTAQGTKILDENWQTFVKAATDGDGRISDGLKEIIRLNATAGTQSREIAGFLQQQGMSAIGGFNATTAGMLDAGGNLKAFDDIKKKVDDATKSGEGLTEALAAQTVAAQSAVGGLADLGIQAVASFTAAVASGTSEADALKAIHPSLALLQQAYADLGLDVDNVALKSLLFRDKVVTAAPQLVAAIGGLNQQMIALDNMGLMNVETFGAMQRTGQAMYERLRDKVLELGGTDTDVLSQMQGFLHQAQIEAEKLGVPLDDNTQKLIDQSKKAGIWQDAITPQDKLLKGMQTLVDKVDDLIRALLGIPKKIDTTVTTTHEDVWTGNNGDAGSEKNRAARGGLVTTTGIRHFGFGGLVSGFAAGGLVAALGMPAFTPHGTDIVPAMLTPNELVLTEANTGRIAEALQAGVQLVAESRRQSLESSSPGLAFVFVRMDNPDLEEVWDGLPDAFKYNHSGIRSKFNELVVEAMAARR